MDNRTVDTINQQIYHRFPDVAGANPTVQPMNSGEKGVEANYLLIYKKNAATASGKSITRVVRVVVSDRGKIIKVSTSK